MTETNLVAAIARNPGAFDGASELTPLLRKNEQRFLKAFADMQRLYPKTVFPPMYFLIGDLRNIASASKDGLLIESQNFRKGSERQFTPLLVHELTHFQQAQAVGIAKYSSIYGLEVPAVSPQSKITLLDLATHTSGLPYWPAGIKPADPSNPLADYPVERLYTSLSTIKLERRVGYQYEYSNFGFALLGKILEGRSGKSYKKLVSEVVTRPLLMKSTTVGRTDHIVPWLTLGHDEKGNVNPHWDMPAFEAAGAIYSSTNDMLKFLGANLSKRDSTLLRAIRPVQQPRHRADSEDSFVGLGWHIERKGLDEIIWHSGGTGGYKSFIGFDKSRKIGIVVFSNSSSPITEECFVLLDLIKRKPGGTNDSKR